MSSFNSAILAVDTVIDASPAYVRALLLDLDGLPQWRKKQQLINAWSIKRTSDSPAVRGIDAKPGDVISIDSVQAGKVEAEIFVNTPEKFGYKGGGYGLLAHHWWEFAQMEEPNRTLLKHCEAWEGGLAFLFWSYSPARLWLGGLFKAFNEDLKEAAKG